MLDETRRHAVCQAAQQAFLHESATTFTCATTCGSGQGNGTFDSCRQLLEIFRNCQETQQISRIQFRIPKLINRRSIFELSREVFFFLFLFFVFFFFLFFISFHVFLVFLKKNYSPSGTEKISETRHIKNLSLNNT